MLLGRRPVRLADLSEDLTLPDDHRVKRRGYPVQMPHGLGVCQPVRVLLERRPLDAPVFGEQIEHMSPSALVLDDGVDLCPVTGREQHGLGDDALVLEAPEEAPASARRESDTLANLDRRRAMAHTRNRDKHRLTSSSRFLPGALPLRRAVSNSSTTPAHSGPKASSSSPLIRRASVGDAPPVETATWRLPLRSVDGTAKSPSEGRSATLMGTPRSFASAATAALTSREPVAVNARFAPSRSPYSYGRCWISTSMPASSGRTSGEITTTSAPACISLPTFLVATAPPPTTTQRLPETFKNMG